MIFKTTNGGERIISFFNEAKIESENFAKQLEKDKIFLTEYFNATGDVAKQQNILNKSTNEASKSAIEYAVSTKGAAGSVSNFEQQQIKANASVQKSKKYYDLSTVSASAYKLAIKGITIVANLATSALLSGVVYAFSKLFSAQNKAIEKAKELTSTYKSNNTSLEDYKEQINTLVTELNTSNISYEDSKTKRKELMSIQDELFKKYGTEENVIKSITAAINGEIDALDTLSQKSYYEWLASVDSLTGGQKFGNGFFKLFTGISDQYKSVLDSAVDYMEDKTQFFYIKTTGNEELDHLIQKKFGLYKNAFNEFVIKDVVPEEAYELLGQIRTAYRDNASEYLGTETDNILAAVDDSIQSAMTTIDTELGKHQETYHTYLEGMIKYDSEYSDEYADLLSKRALLEEAELSTNDEGKQQRILEAKKAFYDSLNNAITSAKNNDNVKRYFENLYPDLYSEISSWNFEYSISTNTDGITDTAKEIGEKYTATALLNMVNTEGVQEGEESFNSLIDKAIEYGVCTNKSAEEVQKLIDLLVELGIVQDNVKGDTYNIEPPISLGILQTVDQLNTRLKPAFDSLKSAYQNIFTDDEFALNSIDILSTCDSIKSKLDELNKIEGITVDYTAFEDFVTVLRNTESTEQDVETAFDSLATSVTQAALSGAEDFETMKAALEDLGVANSEMAAFNALIKNTKALKEAGLDLADAEDEDIQAFTDAIVSTENYDKALNLLRIQKILCAENPLSTTDDIQNLYMLAQASGIAANAIQTLMTLNTAYTKASAEGNTLATAAVKGQMELVKKQVMDQFANLGSNVDFSNIGGGTKSAGDAYADAFEEELKALEDLRNNGLISEKEYLDRLRILYERHFKNKLGYEKEYAKYQRQYLDGYKSLYESIFSHAAGLIDDKIDGMQEERDAAVASLEAQKKAAEDSYNAQIKLLEDKKDAIQEEIDKIREANEDRKEAITLQEKERSLARAENQKTILQYTEGRGFFYTADAEAVQTARQELDDARTEAQIRVLEKQQDALDKQIDTIKDLLEASNAYWDAQIGQTNHYYDALIKGMEGYRDRFSSLSGLQEHARMIALLQELGYTEADLLDQNSGALERLMHSYLGILKDMSGNDSGILGGLSGLTGIDMNTVPGFLEQMEQQVHGITDAFVGKEEGTGMTGAVQKAINKIGAAGSEEEDPESLLSALSAQTDAALDEETGIPAQTAAWENMNGPLDHSLDTVSALKSTLEEMDGKVYSVALNITGAGAALGIAGAGTTLGKQLISQYKTDGKASKSDTSGDKNIPIPLQKGDPFYDIMEKAKNLVPELSYDASADYVKNLVSHSTETIRSHINYINNNTNRAVTQNIRSVNLSCPNVTNSSGVEYIQRELGNLSSRAMQEAYKS